MSEAYPIDEHFLQTRGWKQSEASFLWIRPADSTGTFFTLKDAIRIERNREKLERESEPQPPSAASAGYHYADAKVVIDGEPCALQEIAADWIRRCKRTDELEQDLKRAHRDVGLASDALDGFFREVIREKPLVLTVDGVLYVVTFHLGNLRYEEAVSPEGVQV